MRRRERRSEMGHAHALVAFTKSKSCNSSTPRCGCPGLQHGACCCLGLDLLGSPGKLTMATPEGVTTAVSWEGMERMTRLELFMKGLGRLWMARTGQFVLCAWQHCTCNGHEQVSAVGLHR